MWKNEEYFSVEEWWHHARRQPRLPGQHGDGWPFRHVRCDSRTLYDAYLAFPSKVEKTNIGGFGKTFRLVHRHILRGRKRVAGKSTPVYIIPVDERRGEELI